jgi:hypothetical protein
MRPLLAALAIPVGLVMLLAGWQVEIAPIDPIPLPAAAVATPVSSSLAKQDSSSPRPSSVSADPRVAARSVATSYAPTPFFVPVATPAIPLSPWHKTTLLRHYLPEPDPYPGMH